MVLLKINGSCLIIDISLRREDSVKSFNSCLSNKILPDFGSNTLVNKLNSVDLPWPDWPTIAIFLFGSKVILNPFKIISSLGYPKTTSLNSIIPLDLVISLVPNCSSFDNLFSNISLTLPIDTITFWYVCS